MLQEVHSLRDVRVIVSRRKWSLVIPSLLVVLAAITTALAWPPTYRSSSTILIEEQEIPRDYVLTTVTGFAEQRLQSINQRIMSATRLLEVINRYDLYREKRNKWTTEETVEQMRKDISFGTINSDVIDPRTGRATAATIAFRLSYDGHDPSLTQQVANVLTSLYLEENLKVRQQQTQGASRFLEGEMEELKNQLAIIDADISAYKEQYLHTLPELSAFNLQVLDRTEQEIDHLQTQLRMLQERESYLASQLAAMPTDDENQDKHRLAELRVKLTELLTRTTEAYPDVKKTRTEIAELEKRLQQSGSNPLGGKPDNPGYVTLAAQLASTRTEIDALNQQVRGFYAKRDHYRQRIERAPRVEEGYKVLLAQRNNVQMKYDELSNKYMEARVAQGLEQDQMGERFTLIEAASYPEKPVLPNRLAILIIGVVLAVVVGVSCAALREYGDHSLRTGDDLGRLFHLPLLASVPLLVTNLDRSRTRRRSRLLFASVAIGLVVGVAVFHFLIMDLDILWAKLVRRLAV